VTEPLLERWLEDVVRTPGLTGIRDLAEARRVLWDDALRARSLVEESLGVVVDVGSGGGSPGIPLAAALPDREFVLLEAERRKCAFLERYAAELPNVRVVNGRSEDQPAESFGVALAKALAKPPAAVELCLPLVVVGGVVVLWVGPSLERGRLAAVAARLHGTVEEVAPGLLVVRKLDRTPPGFPRKPGMAKKRPLA
jgi:16S rRNA (guanine527-N7)-methyltransferase